MVPGCQPAAGRSGGRAPGAPRRYAIPLPLDSHHHGRPLRPCRPGLDVVLKPYSETPLTLPQPDPLSISSCLAGQSRLGAARSTELAELTSPRRYVVARPDTRRPSTSHTPPGGDENSRAWIFDRPPSTSGKTTGGRSTVQCSRSPQRSSLIRFPRDTP